MRICIVGGGPGGLFLALQLHRASPSHDIRIVEQNPRGATYGFGVSVQEHALERIRGYNEAFYRRFLDHTILLRGRTITVNDESVFIDTRMGSRAIARVDLLNVLLALCEEAGLTVEFERRVTAPADLADHDLVVAADGANSAVRNALSDAFGTETTTISNRFAWYGTERVFEGPGLIFRETTRGGFVGHYYPYSASMSTFVAECDAATWTSAGLADLTDDERKAVCEEVFAPELAGHGLVSNRSIWRNYEAVSNRRWTHGRYVLIGDARRAAHPSIGSGTRLALDDAQTLFEAIVEHAPDVEAIGAAYEEVRRPVAGILTDAMEASYRWYEDFRTHMRLPPIEFAYSYMTRTGRMSDERLASDHPDFMRRWARHVVAREAARTAD